MVESAKISIVIPVYNTEKYLRECLDSIINQTFSDWEVICVNDGSTDNSLEILKEYEQKDRRFVVITQQNKGVSTARNVGMQQAKGEYLMFVDSDDWLADDACEKVYNTSKDRGCDILIFSHYEYTDTSCKSDGRLQNLYLEIKDKSTDFQTSFANILIAPNNVCGKLYKTSFLKQNAIIFPPNIQSGEDKIFYTNACILAKSICVLFEHLYYYRVNAANSLTKNEQTVVPHLYTMHLELKKMLQSYNMSNYNIVYALCLDWAVNILLWQWERVHNIFLKSKNIKYLKQFARECKNLPKENRELIADYNRLLQAIADYKWLYWKKLYEPLFEIEFRRNRIALYLFEKQIINISTINWNNFWSSIYYFKHLCKVRMCTKFRKIRIGFWITETQKWSSLDSLYKALLNSPFFEPYILIATFKNYMLGISSQEHIQNSIKFFEEKGYKYKLVYNTKQCQHLELKQFKPDIVFYQQPWQIPDKQSVAIVEKSSLICYVPYCFYSLDSYTNYMAGFHGRLWKYFVESDLHNKEYKQKYNATNCVTVGSSKMDNYKYINQSQINNIWRTTNKKRIIYAPHHSFDKSIHNLGTFKYNGNFILQLAISHPEYEWIFRPHARFKLEVLANKIMTLPEIDDYYKQWEKLGSVYSGGDYYEMFAGSDCLITDCISFLSEYLPTGKPVIHLRKDEQKENFNALVQAITDSYYKVYDNETLLKIFNEVIVNGNDYLNNKRQDSIKLLMIDNQKTTGEKIKEYLEKELWIRG